MAFFGLEQQDLEAQKREFIKNGLEENVEVFTWGEEGYDGLADALQEGGDDKNNETFGDVGTIGKDFDFGHPQGLTSKQTVDQQKSLYEQPSLRAKQPARQPVQSLEAIWADDSSYSMFPRTNPTPNRAVGGSLQQTSSVSSKFSQLAGGDSSSAVNYKQGSGIRTLEEIEAEMRVSRGMSQRQQQEELLRQEELIRQEERLLHEQQVHLQRLQNQQEQQIQLQRLRDLQLQQAHQSTRTPPPRMLPRYNDQERERLQFLQLQQEQQHQAHLIELQEQARVEELERQFRVQQISQLNQGPNHYRQAPASLLDIQAEQQLEQLHRHGLSVGDLNNYENGQTQQHFQQLPPHLRDQLLGDSLQAQFLANITPAQQEMLQMEAMRKIVAAEKMEEKRRRKAAKIQHMARYNDVMTQSDKDFITRIQVSQLVTQDPYAEDFYAQVYGALLRSRVGMDAPDRVLKFGSGGGVGLGIAQKGGNRRPNAMQRMEAQVERIVSNARLREKEKGLHSLHSLQGALGKTSGRSYKAAPRQLLQVDPSAASSPTTGESSKDGSSPTAGGAAIEAAKLGREALGVTGEAEGGLIRKEPLSHRQVLVILETMYDLVLRIDHLRHNQPHQDEGEAVTNEWSAEYDEYVKQLWDGLRVMVPLETSFPHPFISLLTPTKGKKLLPRIMRYLDDGKTLTMLTLLVACYSQLDVVVKAPLLDAIENTLEREDLERQTQTFLGSVLHSLSHIVATASLRLITGLLGLLLDRTDVVVTSQTRPGLNILTLFLTRVEVIKQGVNQNTTPDDEDQWQLMFDHLFQLLTPHLSRLFPSNRIGLAPTGAATLVTDVLDQPVWHFLATLALHSTPAQHRILVEALREKVLETVQSANKGWVVEEDERRVKLASVNLFLHSISLDSSQIVI